MNANELIESGIIELYCLGIASDEEQSLVELLASEDISVSEEIEVVNDALANYAVAAPAIHPPKGLKEKILTSIQSSLQNTLPPKLTAESTPQEWIDYLDSQNIKEPEHYEGVHVVELPGTDDYYTYAVFAHPGDIVPEETHFGHDEFLLFCTGTCEMEIGGINGKYKAGEFIAILPGVPHSALVTGKERMIAIGQRRAA